MFASQTHTAVLLTQAFALSKDFPCYLEAAADVGVVGLRHSQLVDGHMRSGQKRHGHLSSRMHVLKLSLIPQLN